LILYKSCLFCYHIHFKIYQRQVFTRILAGFRGVSVHIHIPILLDIRIIQLF
jgi:hypothetical protein